MMAFRRGLTSDLWTLDVPVMSFLIKEETTMSASAKVKVPSLNLFPIPLRHRPSFLIMSLRLASVSGLSMACWEGAFARIEGTLRSLVIVRNGCFILDPSGYRNLSSTASLTVLSGWTVLESFKADLGWWVASVVVGFGVCNLNSSSMGVTSVWSPWLSSCPSTSIASPVGVSWSWLGSCWFVGLASDMFSAPAGVVGVRVVGGGGGGGLTGSPSSMMSTVRWFGFFVDLLGLGLLLGLFGSLFFPLFFLLLSVDFDAMMVPL